MLGYIGLFLMDMIQELMITTLPKIVMEDIIWLDIKFPEATRNYMLMLVLGF